VAAFVELARQGSLRLAAGILHITEQGVRNRLLALEQRLGVELYQKRRGVRRRPGQLVVPRRPQHGAAHASVGTRRVRADPAALRTAQQLRPAGSRPSRGCLAANSDSDTSLRVTNLPANLVLSKGGMIYITEIFTRHNRITPLDNFGVLVPQTLYSIAYF